MQCLLYMHWNILQSTGILYSGMLYNILVRYYFKLKLLLCYNKLWAQNASLCSFGFNLAFIYTKLRPEEEEGWLCDLWGDLRLADSWTDRRMAEVDRWSIDKLGLSNLTTWKFQIKHLLLTRGLWGPGQRNGGTSGRSNCPANNKKSQKAFSTMVITISLSQLYLVTSCDSPIAAWRAFRALYARE